PLARVLHLSAREQRALAQAPVSVANSACSPSRHLLDECFESVRILFIVGSEHAFAFAVAAGHHPVFRIGVHRLVADTHVPKAAWARKVLLYLITCLPPLDLRP